LRCQVRQLVRMRRATTVGGPGLQQSYGQMGQQSYGQMQQAPVVRKDFPGVEENVAQLQSTHRRVMLAGVEHQIARDNFKFLYYLVLVPSIAICAFLAVLGVCFPNTDERSQQDFKLIGGFLNAFNTVLLAMGGLLKYQSRCEVHSAATSQCIALRTEVEELESTLQTLAFGVQTQDSQIELDYFLRKFNRRLETIYGKYQEIGEMAPVPAWITVKAKGVIMKLQQMELENDLHKPLARSFDSGQIPTGFGQVPQKMMDDPRGGFGGQMDEFDNSGMMNQQNVYGGHQMQNHMQMQGPRGMGAPHIGGAPLSAPQSQHPSWSEENEAPQPLAEPSPAGVQHEEAASPANPRPKGTGAKKEQKVRLPRTATGTSNSVSGSADVEHS